jgi:hypothetical protein
MDVLSVIAEIIRDLLIFVVVMFALPIALIVIVSKMPADNPLKRVLTALSYRIGATAAAGLLAIPIEPIPGLDVLYDIGVPVALIIYWISFFKNASRTTTDLSLRRAQRQLRRDGLQMSSCPENFSQNADDRRPRSAVCTENLNADVMVVNPPRMENGLMLPVRWTGRKTGASLLKDP